MCAVGGWGGEFSFTNPKHFILGEFDLASTVVFVPHFSFPYTSGASSPNSSWLDYIILVEQLQCIR